MHHVRPHAPAQPDNVALFAQVAAVSRHDAVHADRLVFKRIDEPGSGVRGVQDGRDVDVVTPALLRYGERVHNALEPADGRWRDNVHHSHEHLAVMQLCNTRCVPLGSAGHGAIPHQRGALA